jgi:hypothetical protein
VKVNENESPGASRPELTRPAALTVCGTAPRFVHVTVVPGATLRDAGVKTLSPISTAGPTGAGVAVAEATVIVPAIPVWISQWYTNVPADANVNDQLAPEAT